MYDNHERKSCNKINTLSKKQQSVGIHVAPLRHILLIPMQPYFALTYQCCVCGGEAANTNCYTKNVVQYTQMITTRGNMSKLYNLPSYFFKNTEVCITSNPTSQFLLVCSQKIRHRFVNLSQLALWHTLLRLHSQAHSMSELDVISVTSDDFVDILNAL